MNIIAQCCGITIMLLLLYFYHSQKKLQLYTQKAFMGIWNASMLSIIFDVASVVAIHNLYKTNLFATEVICTTCTARRTKKHELINWEVTLVEHTKELLTYGATGTNNSYFHFLFVF